MSRIVRAADSLGPLCKVHEAIATDRRLSWKAKGIMFYLLTKPDDWKVRVQDIVAQGKEGEKSVQAALKELETHGYLFRKILHPNETSLGTLDWDTTVFEIPFKSLTNEKEVTTPDLQLAYINDLLEKASPKVVNIFSLPYVLLEDKEDLPNKPCVYFVADSETIYYIGKAVDAYKRWLNHHRYENVKSINGVKIHYLILPEALLKRVEIDFINWYQPEFNGISKVSA